MEFLASLERSHLIEALGFAASGATLCAFAQKQMLPMRIAAIAANLFFIAYGAVGWIYPVLLLHLVLLPLNIGRLFEQEMERRRALASRHAGRDPMAFPRRRGQSLSPYAAGHSMAAQIRRGSRAF